MTQNQAEQSAQECHGSSIKDKETIADLLKKISELEKKNQDLRSECLLKENIYAVEPDYETKQLLSYKLSLNEQETRFDGLVNTLFAESQQIIVNVSQWLISNANIAGEIFYAQINKAKEHFESQAASVLPQFNVIEASCAEHQQKNSTDLSTGLILASISASCGNLFKLRSDIATSNDSESCKYR